MVNSPMDGCDQEDKIVTRSLLSRPLKRLSRFMALTSSISAMDRSTLADQITAEPGSFNILDEGALEEGVI